MKILSTDGVLTMQARLRICADIEQLRAKQEGVVEFKDRDPSVDGWRRLEGAPKYDLMYYDYRVRPQPAVLYGLRNADGSLVRGAASGGLWTSETIENTKPFADAGYQLVTFVEKLD